MLLDELVFDFRLTDGTAETGSYGNNFNGATDADGLVAALFTGTGADLPLSFNGFDVDFDDEVELFLNGDSIGFLDAGVNNGLEAYEFLVAEDDQVLGDNLLEFRQDLNPTFKWGVTDVLIEDAIL